MFMRVSDSAHMSLPLIYHFYSKPEESRIHSFVICYFKYSIKVRYNVKDLSESIMCYIILVNIRKKKKITEK